MLYSCACWQAQSLHELAVLRMLYMLNWPSGHQPHRKLVMLCVLRRPRPSTAHVHELLPRVGQPCGVRLPRADPQLVQLQEPAADDGGNSEGGVGKAGRVQGAWAQGLWAVLLRIHAVRGGWTSQWNMLLLLILYPVRLRASQCLRTPRPPPPAGEELDTVVFAAVDLSVIFLSVTHTSTAAIMGLSPSSQVYCECVVQGATQAAGSALSAVVITELHAACGNSYTPLQLVES